MIDMNSALKELRLQKDKVGTPGHFLYKMLETAHPSVISYMEKQAAAMLVFSRNTFDLVKEKEKTAEGRQELEKILSEMSARNSMTVFSREQEQSAKDEKDKEG